MRQEIIKAPVSPRFLGTKSSCDRSEVATAEPATSRPRRCACAVLCAYLRYAIAMIQSLICSSIMLCSMTARVSAQAACGPAWRGASSDRQQRRRRAKPQFRCSLDVAGVHPLCSYEREGLERRAHEPEWSDADWTTARAQGHSERQSAKRCASARCGLGRHSFFPLVSSGSDRAAPRLSLPVLARVRPSAARRVVVAVLCVPFVSLRVAGAVFVVFVVVACCSCRRRVLCVFAAACVARMASGSSAATRRRDPLALQSKQAHTHKLSTTHDTARRTRTHKQGTHTTRRTLPPRRRQGVATLQPSPHARREPA